MSAALHCDAASDVARIQFNLSVRILGLTTLCTCGCGADIRRAVEASLPMIQDAITKNRHRLRPTLAAFYDRLAEANWCYDEADDMSTMKAGRQQIAEIFCDAQAYGHDYQELLSEYRRYLVSGAPKPERPEDEPPVLAHRRMLNGGWG